MECLRGRFGEWTPGRTCCAAWKRAENGGTLRGTTRTVQSVSIRVVKRDIIALPVRRHSSRGRLRKLCLAGLRAYVVRMCAA